ncbi:hypothetical protein F8M41_001000 [Gigaspora margarita]|uniref:Uncharacterized protein n=1 Tax=Gigaspora margarita TaxID=4874 RepID=A0A8H4AZ70_GIGMA|nr:hypothetical protein F8M41_001000 [Gigaspora margarita]
MDTCTSCNYTYEAFIYENKSYKTCAKCKTNRAKKKKSIKTADINNEEVPIEIIAIDKINISNIIDGLEYDTALFFYFSYPPILEIAIKMHPTLNSF